MIRSVEKKGFVWGRIYIVLAIVFGALSILGGAMGMMSKEQGSWVDIPLIIAGTIQLLSGIGLWGRHKWGLYLTYIILAIHFCASTMNFIYALRFGPVMLNGVETSTVAASIVGYLIALVIIALWLGYFIRRRAMFR
ncbi:MAG: hypothetical protein JSR80_01945 [Verrucomicrobia bacterium]|nr:hypothetical protein [Verrucomicrobiota bacterium]